MRTNAPRGPSGFTLVEIVIALVLLELLLLGSLVLLQGATRVFARATIVEVSVWEASAVADSATGSGSERRGWGDLRWSGAEVVARDSLGDTLVALSRGRW